MQCNDIDLKIHCINKTSLRQIDRALASAINELIGLENNFPQELEEFRVKFPEEREENENHFFALRVLPQAAGYISDEPKEYIAGALDYVPLEINIHCFEKRCDLTPIYPEYLGGPDSFFIPLDLFEGELGTSGVHQFQFFSVSGKEKHVLEDACKGVYRFSKTHCTTGLKWVRLLMNITEGFYDPESDKERLSFTPFLTTGELLFQKFKNHVKKRRDCPGYYTFCLINGAFHASEGYSLDETKSFQNQFDRELHSVLQREGAFSFFADLCKEYPADFIRTLLKLFAPLLAENVSYKSHWGKDHLQCKFLLKEKSLCLLLPYLDEEDVFYLTKIFSCETKSASKLLETYKEIAFKPLGERKKFSLLLLQLLQKRSFPILEEKLQPIFDNQIAIYSPEEKKEKIFKTKQFLHAFISNLRHENLPFVVDLGGSSITNQCVTPLYLECNDVDIHAILYTEKEKILEIFKLIQRKLLSTLTDLLKINENSKYNIKDFKIESKTFCIWETYYILYSLNAATTNTPLFPIQNTSSHLPIDLCIILICNKENKYPLSMGNSNSLYVTINAFEEELGTTVPNKYTLASHEGDCLEVICDLQKKIFTSKNPQCVSDKGWFRFIMKMTEGLSSPSSHNNHVFYKATSIHPEITNRFKDLIKQKRKLQDYYLFSLINALFHALDEEKEGDVLPFTEELILSFSSKHLDLRAPFWMRSLDTLLDLFPKSHIPTLLKIFIPLWASEVSSKIHLGQNQWHTEFTHLEKKLYLWIPLLDEKDELFLNDIFSWISSSNFPFLKEKISQELLKTQFTKLSKQEKEEISSFLHHKIQRRKRLNQESFPSQRT